MRCLRDLQSLECTFWNEGDFLDYFKKKSSLDKQGLIVLHYSVINHKEKEKKKFLVQMHLEIHSRSSHGK